MAIKTRPRALSFLKDYKEKEPWLTRNFQVTRAGGLRLNKSVGIAHEDSVEFLLVEILNLLEVIRRALAGGWNDPGYLSLRSSENARPVKDARVPHF